MKELIEYVKEWFDSKKDPAIFVLGIRNGIWILADEEHKDKVLEIIESNTKNPHSSLGCFPDIKGVLSDLARLNID